MINNKVATSINNQATSCVVLVLLIFGSLFAFLSDWLFNFGYWEKSLFKLLLFILIPCVITLIKPNYHLFKSLRLPKSKHTLIQPLLLGFCIYFIILIGFYFIQQFISFDVIKRSLSNNVSVDATNFVFVALYISVINSLIEEYFFRGLGFFNLKLGLEKSKSTILSSSLFALYHIGMVDGWASPFIIALAIGGLFIVGLVFIKLNEKFENIYSSYMVHMFANLAINTIGLHMFEIINLPFLT